MSTYTITTDAFSCDIEAASIDAAITEAFEGERLGKIDSAESLESTFAKYVDDGGWCHIECDGERVLAIGQC